MNIQNRLAVMDKQYTVNYHCWHAEYDIIATEYTTYTFWHYEYWITCVRTFPTMLISARLSLQDMRNINCSWLLIFWNSGCLDLIFVYKIWRSWALIWHLVIKCSSSSTSRHQAHSLCVGCDKIHWVGTFRIHHRQWYYMLWLLQ